MINWKGKIEQKIYEIFGKEMLKGGVILRIARAVGMQLEICEIGSLYSYCRKNDGIVKVFDENEYHICRKPAKNIEEFEQKKELEQKRGFKIYTAKIKGAFVASEMDAVIKDGQYLTDRTEWDCGGIVLHLPSCIKKIDKKKCLLKIKKNQVIHIPKGINLIKMWGRNYFHFTFEIVSRLQYIDEMLQYKDYPLLVDEAVLEDEKNAELLQMINIDGRPIIKVKSNEMYRVDELIVPAIHAWSMQDYQEQERGYGWILSDRCAAYMRKKILKNYCPKTIYTKVYVTRGNNQRLVNELEVADYLKKNGFMIVNPDEITLSEEIDCFATADYIIGVTGAAFTNVIYCKEDAKILQICPFEYQFAGGAVIADSVGVDMKYISADVYRRERTMNRSKFVLAKEKYNSLIERA